MALTATAAKKLRTEIIQGLRMKRPIVIAANPDKSNIRYEVIPFVSINKTFGALAEQLREKQMLIGKAVIFCQTLSDCPKIYRFFRSALGDDFTYPAGSPDICGNRIVDIFHSCTETCIKDKIIAAFSAESSPLRVVVATTAFGMGIDISNIRTIIHFGSCEDIDTYLQAVGRAGRDGNPSKAIILSRRGANQHIDMQMITVQITLFVDARFFSATTMYVLIH